MSKEGKQFSSDVFTYPALLCGRQEGGQLKPSPCFTRHFFEKPKKGEVISLRGLAEDFPEGPSLMP